MKLNDRCFVVYGLTTFSPWMVSAGIIVGDGRTLIVDCGANYLSAQTIHGYASVARPTNKLVAINTESHSDHMGGNCFFRELGIDVYGHEGVNRTEDQLNAMKEYFNSLVPNAFRRENREGDLVFLRTKLVNPNMRFRNDFVLDLGGIEVQILMTPGHTRVNSSVFVPSLKTLYCGDTIVNGYVPNLEEGSVDDWHRWLESLDRIDQLAPDIVVPGHGEVMRGADIDREIGRTRDVLNVAIRRGVAPTEAGS